MLTFSYLPYALAEGIHLSGEMTNTSTCITFSLKITFVVIINMLHVQKKGKYTVKIKTQHDCSLNACQFIGTGRYMH